MNVNYTQHRSIVLAGGGTAGHVNPLLATADAISRNDSAAAVTIVGTEKVWNKNLFRLQDSSCVLLSGSRFRAAQTWRH
ncbi:glycosyltransferase [Arcanobacterium hippocoleae]